MAPAPEFAVLEISSFQLETIINFKPEIAIWLNFAPDHMDRYKKVEDYYNAKCRLFENMGRNQIAIVREGEQLPDIKPRRVGFSSVVSSGQLYYADGNIMEGGRVLMPLRGTTMEQAHNAENTMAATLACRALGIDAEDIAKGVHSFCPPGHRCETVAEMDGILWLNDSKSTNLHSTEAAVRSQTRPIVLIAGGKDKGWTTTPSTPCCGTRRAAASSSGKSRSNCAPPSHPSAPRMWWTRWRRRWRKRRGRRSAAMWCSSRPARHPSTSSRATFSAGNASAPPWPKRSTSNPIQKEHLMNKKLQESILGRAKPKRHVFRAFINSKLKQHRSDTGLVEDSSNSTVIIRVIVGLLLLHLVLIGGALLRGQIKKSGGTTAVATTITAPPPRTTVPPSRSRPHP